MRSNEARIAEVYKRAARLRRERGRRRVRAACAGAGAVCLALAVTFAVFISRVPSERPKAAMPESRMASIFVENGVLDCVIVAVLAFLLGVLFTVFCVRLKKRAAEKEKNDDRKL